MSNLIWTCKHCKKQNCFWRMYCQCCGRTEKGEISDHTKREAGLKWSSYLGQ